MLIVYPFFLQTSRVFKREVLWYNSFNWIFTEVAAMHKKLCLLPALALAEAARRITVMQYLETYHPGELVRKTGREYCTRTHDI